MTAVVGLVGSIGAGKSTAAGWLAAAGADVVDGDQIGHQVLGEPVVIDAVVAALGPDVRTADGALSRRRIAEKVFADRALLARLERILHPQIRRSIGERIESARRRGARWVVVDAAVLFEAGWDDLCDVVIFVDAPVEERLRRVAGRGWTSEELARREKSQWSNDKKKELADAVFVNVGDPLERQARLVALVEELTAGSALAAAGEPNN